MVFGSCGVGVDWEDLPLACENQDRFPPSLIPHLHAMNIRMELGLDRVKHSYVHCIKVCFYQKEYFSS